MGHAASEMSNSACLNYKISLVNDLILNIDFCEWCDHNTCRFYSVILNHLLCALREKKQKSISIVEGDRSWTLTLTAIKCCVWGPVTDEVGFKKTRTCHIIRIKPATLFSSRELLETVEKTWYHWEAQEHVLLSDVCGLCRLSSILSCSEKTCHTPFCWNAFRHKSRSLQSWTACSFSPASPKANLFTLWHPATLYSWDNPQMLFLFSTFLLQCHLQRPLEENPIYWHET